MGAASARQGGHMRSMLYAGAACALVLFAGQATADDSSAAIGMGGIEFTQSSDIRMANEDLRISPKRVDIRFVFVNDSRKDIDTMMAFPLPDIDTSVYTESPLGLTTNDPVNFVGFAIKADGKPVPFSVEQRAFYQGRDVTAFIHGLGLPLNMVAPGFYKKLEALSADKKKKLEAAGLSDKESGDDEHPHWVVRTRFFWRQHFPAGRSVVFEQSYQPVTGGAFFSNIELDTKTDSGAYYAKNFCLDAGARATLVKLLAAGKRIHPDQGELLNAFTTQYILKTGNNWKGPIGHFHLTLDKEKPENVLSLCWDGALKKTGATTFEDTRENFSPKSDIALLVLQDLPPIAP
jgi:hypothetical protein